MLLADLSWSEIREYLAREDRLILPIGAVEQHGRQLGVGCDWLIAERIAVEAGERTGLAVAPALAYGMSLHHMRFSGTLSLRPATLILVLEDLLRSMHAHGARRVLVVNGHGGNTAALESALAVSANELENMRVKTFEWWKEPELLQLVDDTVGPQRGTHASPAETAFMLAVRPEAVNLDLAMHRDAPVERSREFWTAARFAEAFPDGVMGLDPTAATPELGSQLLARCVEYCVAELARW